jgi:hypothetical protein
MIRSKRTLKTLLLGIGISFALVACKDASEPTPKPEEPPLLLKKINWTEKDFLTISYNEKKLPTQYTSQWVFDPDGNISTYQVTFDYDSQNRLIQVNANLGLKNKYHYQGNVLQKTEEYDHKNRLVITHTYTFDQQKRLLQIIDDITDPVDQATAKLKHTYEYDQRGNLTYLKDYQFNPSTQTYDLTYTQAWEGYDNQKNPDNLRLSFPYLPGVTLQVNNPGKKSVIQTNGIVTETQTYSYQYNEKGYPTQRTAVLQSGTKTATITGVYEYE